MNWLIPPAWFSNENDLFQGDYIVKILAGKDENGVIQILDVIYEEY